jgi:hypothetical protein
MRPYVVPKEKETVAAGQSPLQVSGAALNHSSCVK